MAEPKKRTRRKKVEPRSRGLAPKDIASEAPSAEVRRLAGEVEGDGGAVLGSYREPLGGAWQLFVALPIERVEPTPFQRDLSEAHLKRLTLRIGELGRFLDPIIAVRRADGTYWTPNGNHRLHALRALGAKSIVALLVPDEQIAYQILALNTEKAHNLREKALEVIRMARELAKLGDAQESECASMFEEPQFLTLGLCYEQNGRFSGGVYQPLLKRLEGFLEQKLSKTLVLRAARAERLFELDTAVVAAVAALKQRGLESPYLKNFVVARINFLRFHKGPTPDFDATLDKLIAAAKKFDAGKVKADQLANAGGPSEE